MKNINVKKIPALGCKDPDNRWGRGGEFSYKEIHKVPKEGEFADLIDLAHAHGVAGWAFLNHATKKFYACQNTNDLGLMSQLDDEWRPKFSVLKIVLTRPESIGAVGQDPEQIFILDEGLADVDGVDDPELTLEEVITDLTACVHFIPKSSQEV